LICRSCRWPNCSSFSPLIADDVFAVLTVEGSLAARDHIGGTAPKQVLAPSRAPVAARSAGRHRRMEKIGKYELVREIGRGATSTVYLGSDHFASARWRSRSPFPAS
jgi:hypothetical protein